MFNWSVVNGWGGAGLSLNTDLAEKLKQIITKILHFIKIFINAIEKNEIGTWGTWGGGAFCRKLQKVESLFTKLNQFSRISFTKNNQLN